MNKKIKSKGFFQPIVLDGNGKIRSRFNEIKRKTRIEKQALASKIFEIGLDALEASHPTGEVRP